MLQHLEALAALALASELEASAPHGSHTVVREQWEEPEQAIKQ